MAEGGVGASVEKAATTRDTAVAGSTAAGSMAASRVVARGRRAAGDRRASTAEAAPAPRAGTDRADSDLRGTLGPRAEAAADTTPARAAAPQAVATATVASGTSVGEPGA